MEQRETDILIIGGGVIGLSCAWYLQQAGREVTVLERESVGSGASHGNCGLITPSHAMPLTAPGMVRKGLGWMFDSRAPFHIHLPPSLSMLAWMMRFAKRCNRRDMLAAMQARAALLNSSRELMQGLVEQHGFDCDFGTEGLTMLFNTEKGFEAHAKLDRFLTEHGIPATRIEGSDLAIFDPSIRDDLAGGFHYDMDVRLRPDRYVAEMLRICRSAGVEILEHQAVAGFDLSAGEIESVHTDDTCWRARHVVLATGAWSPRLGRQLQLKLPIQPGTGYTLTMPRPEPCPKRAMLCVERKVAATPWERGFRLGGTLEFRGFTKRLNQTRLTAIRDSAAQYFVSTGEDSEAEPWHGWRPMTPDDLPIIGASPRHKDLTLACGHCMLGMSMSPATGQLVSELILGQPAHIDPAPFSAARFRN